MLKIGICGISGRMGRSILGVLLERGHTLGAAFESQSSKYFGQDAGSLIQAKNLDVKIKDINEHDLHNVDGVIDFSSPSASISLVEYMKKEKKPLVIGTTGFSADQMKKMDEAARDIPLIVSPNMSIGVNVLFKLVEMASKALESGFDREVFEAHHKLKKDAPSGTAKKLIDILKNNSPTANPREIYDRSGIIGERKNDEIGVMVLRGGDIVGEHTVYFTGMGERLELTHRATNREILARGAVHAFEYLVNKSPGLYTMFDVLGI